MICRHFQTEMIIQLRNQKIFLFFSKHSFLLTAKDNPIIFKLISNGGKKCLQTEKTKKLL